MKKIYKRIIFLIFTIGLIILLKSEVNAASINISAPTSITVGKSCTITITGTGAATYDVIANISGAGISEKIYLNAYTDDLQNGTKSASKSVVPTTTGTITVSIASSSNVTISGASSSQSISASSKKITVNEETKIEETKPQTPTTTTKPETTTTTKKPTTTNTQKTTTTTKVETKTEEKKEDNFYISSVTLKGIKENDEQIDIVLSPVFNKDTYEYTCNITSDIQKIDLQKDAGEYTNSVIVTGLEELKEGENIIKLQLSAEDHESKTYTIKVIKEKQEIIETVAQPEENKLKQTDENKQIRIISMPLWVFIVMQIIIIIIEVLIMYLVPWKNLFKRNKNIDID